MSVNVLPTSNTEHLPIRSSRTSASHTTIDSRSFWSAFGLVRFREFFITVDHFPIWRQHVGLAFDNGKVLREYVTQRYAISMNCMFLLIGIELMVLFSSADVTTKVRQALRQQDFCNLSFWVGLVIIMSLTLTILSIISIFTAWNMVSSIDEANVYCVLGSSLGQHVVELPGRFMMGSVYSLFICVCMFTFLLLPIGFFAIFVLTIVLILFVYTIMVFSAFGRIIMHSGAMGTEPIVQRDNITRMPPNELHNQLFGIARDNANNKISAMEKYRSIKRPFGRITSEEDNPSGLSDDDSNRDQEVHKEITDENQIDSTHRCNKAIPSFEVLDGSDSLGRKYLGKPMIDYTLSSSERIAKCNGISPPKNLTGGYDDVQVLQSDNSFSLGRGTDENIDAYKSNLSENWTRNSPTSVPRVDDAHRSSDDDKQRKGALVSPVISPFNTSINYTEEKPKQQILDFDLPPVEDKDVWYNGIYFGDDEEEEVFSEQTSLLRKDQVERGKYLSMLSEVSEADSVSNHD